MGREIKPFLALAEEFLTSWRLDESERIHTLVGQRANHLENSVAGSGHSYAMVQAMRGFSQGAWLDELQGGLTQVRFMRELAKLSPEGLMKQLEPFKELLKRVLIKENLSVFVAGTQEDYALAEAGLLNFFTSLPSGEAALGTEVAFDLPAGPLGEAWTTTTPVSYVAKAYLGPAENDSDAAKFMVLSSLVKSAFLHREIREKGGAYGGMASYHSQEGAFAMVSYRDPQLARTLKVYDQAVDWLKAGHFSEENLKEAILLTLGNMDTPLSPVGKATREYSLLLRGRGLAERQAFREGVISTTKDEVRQAAEKWLSGSARVAAVTSKEALARDEKELPLPLTGRAV